VIVVAGTADLAAGKAAGRVEPASRRDRMRAATVQEIKQTARRLLIEQGKDAISLRAIAREMGMTAPALYRYFASHDELLKNVIGDIYLEVAADVEAAIDAAPPGDLAARLTASARAFRRWSLRHQREFGLVFATPPTSVDLENLDYTEECGLKFCGVFLALYLELWQQQPFRVPAAADIDPGLRAQLDRFREAFGTDLPTGAVLSYAYAWVRLYGMVSMEVYGQLGWMLDDAEPIFEMMLKEILPVLGLQYQPPPGSGGPPAVYP
jgi:AcrR family transcriptional regulator